jgi:hypothetical protein
MIRKCSWFDLQEYDKPPKYYRVFYQPSNTTTIWMAIYGLHFILAFICKIFSYVRTGYYIGLHNYRILMFMKEYKEPIGVYGLLVMVYLTLRKKPAVPPLCLIKEYLQKKT